MAHWYRIMILDPGKQPLFLLLVGLMLSFLTVRINTRLIRAGARFKLPHFRHGDVHVHHVVFGIAGMVITGVFSFATQPTAPWRDIFAFFFGANTALVLDEFALVLHIEDVYWTDRGRKSIDAIILVFSFGGLLLLGTAPLGLSDQGLAGISVGPLWVLSALILGNSVLVGITVLKGKIWQGMAGIFIPLVAWFGAIRLARPDSPWARSYAPASPKFIEAQARACVWIERKRRLWDLVGGAPTGRSDECQ
jgi:hypothetical protein